MSHPISRLNAALKVEPNMSKSRSLHRTSVVSLTAVLAISAGGVNQVSAQAPQNVGRPMSFLDVQQFSSPGSWAPSLDGRWMLYTISTPDWQEDDRQSDIHLVSMEDGVVSSRQMTFTGDKNETSPKWSRDGSFFVLASNRDAETDGDERDDEDENQLYLMRPGGGEAQRITDAEEGVSDFDLSDDGRSLVYRGGASGEEQLYRLPVDGILSAEPEQLTQEEAGVERWRWAPGGGSIYFTRPDSRDEDDALRRR